WIPRIEGDLHMTRFRALAAILLALMPPLATRVTAQQTKPAAPTKKTAAPAASRDLLPFNAVEKTLPNELKVIVVPTGFPDLVSVQIPVQTGSRNEVEPGKSGFAHFFEHMMFRGTEAYPPEKYQDIVTRSGARQNAYTTDDYTNYHTTFPKEDLETILKIEADRFQNLSYSESSRSTGEGGSAARAARRCRRSRPRRGPSMRMSPGRPTRCPGSRSPSTARRFPRRRRTSPRSTPCSICRSARRRTSTSASWSRSRSSTASSRASGSPRTPSSSPWPPVSRRARIRRT